MVSGEPVADRRSARREATIQEIVEASWALAREQGLTGFSLRELGERVGMRPQSLYSYFASKHELYDAMFADASRAFIAWSRTSVEGLPGDGDLVRSVEHMVRRFFEFCVHDPVRHQLLFQRTIPDFAPSQDSFTLAVEALDVQVAPFHSLGLTGADVDLVTAVASGLVAQQLANDPGGDRWQRLIGRTSTMLVRELLAVHDRFPAQAEGAPA